MNRSNAKGFTLIELVVVIVILAILAAVALPRFTELSAEAHRASVQGTAGALGSAVALVKAQWTAEGSSGAGLVEGFGQGNVVVDDEGWPQSVQGGADGPCQNLWRALLQSNAPSIPATTPTNGSPDYSVSADGDVCVYGYELDDRGAEIRYDRSNGEVTVENNA